jgi:hypothetical protein
MTSAATKCERFVTSSSLARTAISLLAAMSVSALLLPAQTSTPTSAPAIPMRDESHHHLIFQNSYVNVFFVEIPPHESTLPHHHDCPYISLPPGDPYSPAQNLVAAERRDAIAYTLGNFSHAVTNSGDSTVRNIAVELIRPQGDIRNGCAAVVKDQSQGPCLERHAGGDLSNSRMVDFGSREIEVESWVLVRGTSSEQLDDSHDMLIAGLDAVTVSGKDNVNFSNVLRGGVLWIPANSQPVFRASTDRNGHFVSMTFKDSGTGKP